MQIFRRVDQTTLINNRNVGGNRPKITFDLSKKKKINKNKINKQVDYLEETWLIS